MENYKGPDRRRTPCAAHEAIDDRLQEGTEVMASLRAGQEALQQMMQTVMDRQLTYIEQTARLEGIVTNGLSHRVKEICEKITTFCASYDARLQRLEQFAWFRDWVTKVRDDIFKNFFKLAVLGGLIYALVHFGDKLVKP